MLTPKRGSLGVPGVDVEVTVMVGVWVRVEVSIGSGVDVAVEVCVEVDVALGMISTGSSRFLINRGRNNWSNEAATTDEIFKIPVPIKKAVNAKRISITAKITRDRRDFFTLDIIGFYNL
jgi:hypothetical protein